MYIPLYGIPIDEMAVLGKGQPPVYGNVGNLQMMKYEYVTYIYIAFIQVTSWRQYLFGDPPKNPRARKLPIALTQLRMFFSTATGFMPVSCDLNIELSTLEDSLNSWPMRSGIVINHFLKQSFWLK